MFMGTNTTTNNQQPTTNNQQPTTNYQQHKKQHNQHDNIITNLILQTSYRIIAIICHIICKYNNYDYTMLCIFSW